MLKVYLNNDMRILDSMKVNVGLPPKGCSWTVPVFALKKKKSVPEILDEEAFVTYSSSKIKIYP
jgi:hypothetical protein